MYKTFKKQLLLILPLVLFSSIHPEAAIVKQGMYQQIIPEILLKKVNVEEPNQAELKLINACRALSEYGTDYPEVSYEILKGINSIDISRILAEYARTSTVFGKVALTKCCAQMTDDVLVLNGRQALIKHFEQHPELAQKITKVFSNAVTAEEKFLHFFKQVGEKEGQDKQMLDSKVFFTTPGFTQFNEDKSTLETTMRLKMLQPGLFVANLLLVPTVLDAFNDTSDKGMLSKITSAAGYNIKNIPSLPSRYVELMTPGLGRSGAMAYTAFVLGINFFNMYKSGVEIKESLDLIYDKQKDLLAVGHLIRSMKIVSQTIAQEETLKGLIAAQSQKLSELFDPSSKATSTDLKHLISELLTSSFQGSPSYLLSQQGKILAAHHLLCRIKGELIPYLEAFGDVDARLAVFTLYQEFKNHPRVTFCLPEFVNSNTPVLEAKGFWHPLINPDFVITNDLIMGHGKAANLIITGPNAGGKTTSLMSLVINIIFAQSFGIAPSSSLRFTPFAKIHSYLDITTNLQEGLSLFAAEVDRSKKLKQSILSCTPGQKTFTIIDELFSGTAPDVASEVGFKFAAQLGEMSHSMAIITTHFPRLTALEKETPRFTNYKVADALIAADGAITYPFKLVKGASTQNIAQHMLEHEGIL